MIGLDEDHDLLDVVFCEEIKKAMHVLRQLWNDVRNCEELNHIFHRNPKVDNSMQCHWWKA